VQASGSTRIRPSLSSWVPAVRPSQSPSPPRRPADLSREDGLLRLGGRWSTRFLSSQGVARRAVCDDERASRPTSRLRRRAGQLHSAHEYLALCSCFVILAVGKFRRANGDGADRLESASKFGPDTQDSTSGEERRLSPFHSVAREGASQDPRGRCNGPGPSECSWRGHHQH